MRRPVPKFEREYFESLEAEYLRPIKGATCDYRALDGEVRYVSLIEYVAPGRWLVSGDLHDDIVMPAIGLGRSASVIVDASGLSNLDLPGQFGVDLKESDRRVGYPIVCDYAPCGSFAPEMTVELVEYIAPGEWRALQPGGQLPDVIVESKWLSNPRL
jgi:hypothetical protein